MQLILRDYQEKAVQDIRNAYRWGYGAPLFVLPTGGGKTATFTYITQQAQKRGSRVLIFVHRVELVRQTSRALHKFGVKHGIINANFTPDLRHTVQVASIQTYHSRLHSMRNDNDIVIIDEAHHAVSPTWRASIEHNKGAKLLGVTATPVRADGLGLGVEAGGIFDIMIEGPQIPDLIAGGYLVEPVTYSVPIGVDMEGVKTTRSDYDRGEMEQRVDRPTITGGAVEHYRKHADGLPAVYFCVSVKHAEHVAEQFSAAGYRAASVDGNTDAGERERVIAGLENGSVQVLTSCDLISEGTDIPNVQVVGLLRPTQSTGLYIQQGGRGLRPAPGKNSCIVFDHVGAWKRHGLLNQSRTWSLDGERQKGKSREVVDYEEEARLQECRKCYMPSPPSPECPYCGEPRKQKRPPREVAGELERIRLEEARAVVQATAPHKATVVKGLTTLAEFQELGRRMGHKPGWAWNQWSAKFPRKAARISNK